VFFFKCFHSIVELNSSLFLFYDIYCSIYVVYVFSSAKKGVIHRDLACRNILAHGIDDATSRGDVQRDENGVAQLRVCVADFGLSCHLGGASSSSSSKRAQAASSSGQRGYAEGVGAIRWEAPEVWSRPGKRLFSRASDVYAFGICMYEMFVGQEPWRECV
jgi:serine/threonine protein kinase